jgi:hypothetical protein
LPPSPHCCNRYVDGKSYYEEDAFDWQASRKGFLLFGTDTDIDEKERRYRSYQILLNELARDGLLMLWSHKEQDKISDLEPYHFSKIGPGRYRHFDEVENTLCINIFRESEDFEDFDNLPSSAALVMFRNVHAARAQFIAHIIKPNPALRAAFDRDEAYKKHNGQPRVSGGVDPRGRKPTYGVVRYRAAAEHLLQQNLHVPSQSAFYAAIRDFIAQDTGDSGSGAPGMDGGPDDRWFRRNLGQQIIRKLQEAASDRKAAEKIAISAE